MSPISTKDLDLYETRNPSSELEEGPLLPLSIHLDELRSKLIISLITLLVTIIIGFSISGEIIKLLLNIAPVGTAFLQIKPGEFFFSSFRVAVYFGLGLASPIIIWQLGSFIFPGLSLQEKKVTLPILTVSPLLFLIGSVFAYFFVVPSMLNFLFSFGKDLITSSISIESFISFTLMITAICGFTFLLPIVIFALANVGILSSKMLISRWRYVVLASLILGAVLTPTSDPFNMSIIFGILIGLYFMSFVVLKVVNK